MPRWRLGITEPRTDAARQACAAFRLPDVVNLSRPKGRYYCRQGAAVRTGPAQSTDEPCANTRRWPRSPVLSGRAGSRVGPLAQQGVIDVGQLHGRMMLG